MARRLGAAVGAGAARDGRETAGHGRPRVTGARRSPAHALCARAGERPGGGSAGGPAPFGLPCHGEQQLLPAVRRHQLEPGRAAAGAEPGRSGEGRRPPVTFRPSTPHHAAGIRTDPAPSLPVASGTSPAATATAAPAEEPPGVRSVRHGLTVRPRAPSPQVCQGVPGPGTEVAPTATPPAASSGSAARSPCRPFTAIGTPASGSRLPAATHASTSRARRSASASHTSVNAHSTGSARSIRSSAPATTSTARSLRARTAEAVSSAETAAASSAETEVRGPGPLNASRPSGGPAAPPRGAAGRSGRPGATRAPRARGTRRSPAR